MQQALEFVTKKKRGGIIEIPAEFVDAVDGEFRVILILNTQKKQRATPTKKRSFKAFKVKTKGYSFNDWL